MTGTIRNPCACIQQHRSSVGRSCCVCDGNGGRELEECDRKQGGEREPRHVLTRMAAELELLQPERGSIEMQGA